MSQQTANDLKAARALIAKGWTRRVYARDRAGRQVPVESPAASRFCPLGARIRVTLGAPAGEADRRGEAMVAALRNASGNQPFDLAAFNDRRGRKKSEVLALFDRAIAAEEQAP